MLKTMLIVGSGGFIGSALRYLVQVNVEKLMSSTFPMGTLLVNVTGSFIIGIIYAFAEKGNLMNPEWRIFLAVGICGGFTTFSTFTMDNLNLLKDNSLIQLLLYTGGSLFLGVLAVYLGIILTRAIL
jgi:fluoride exporter